MEVAEVCCIFVSLMLSKQLSDDDANTRNWHFSIKWRSCVCKYHTSTRVKIQIIIKNTSTTTLAFTYLDPILRKVSYETDSFKVTTEATNTDELEVFRSTTPCACKTNTKMIQSLRTYMKYTSRWKKFTNVDLAWSTVYYEEGD